MRYQKNTIYYFVEVFLKFAWKWDWISAFLPTWTESQNPRKQSHIFNCRTFNIVYVFFSNRSSGRQCVWLSKLLLRARTRQEPSLSIIHIIRLFTITSDFERNQCVFLRFMVGKRNAESWWRRKCDHDISSPLRFEGKGRSDRSSWFEHWSASRCFLSQLLVKWICSVVGERDFENCGLTALRWLCISQHTRHCRNDNSRKNALLSPGGDAAIPRPTTYEQTVAAQYLRQMNWARLAWQVLCVRKTTTVLCVRMCWCACKPAPHNPTETYYIHILRLPLRDCNEQRVLSVLVRCCVFSCVLWKKKKNLKIGYCFA